MITAPQKNYQQAVKSSHFYHLVRREHRIIRNPKALKRLTTMIQQPMVQGHEKKNKMKIKKPIQRKHQSKPQPRKIQRRRLATVTAAPRSSTPPPLFCFFFLLLRPLLWWPRESEGERAVHRPHTHSSFSLCVCPLAWTLALTSSHEAHT
ncbi:mucin-associated surface protein (MASP) [Trypanosoma cruzi]|nr:mucin-associated surface protein (MASP) [Trypanosoma cruzi]